MPGMRGDELVRAIRLERPGIAAIFTSGHPGVEELDAQVSLVQKPFTFPELGRGVRTVLDEGRQRKKKEERRHRRRPASSPSRLRPNPVSSLTPRHSGLPPALPTS